MKKSFLFSVLFALILAAPAFAADEDDPTVLYNKGIDLYDQDKIEQSISSFKKAIEIDPDFYEAYYNLARIEEAAGKFQDAIVSYQKLLDIRPTDYESAYQLAELLYKKDYLSKALEYLALIASNSEYRTKADVLTNKITQKQAEILEESRIKAQQNLKVSVLGNVPAPSGLVIDSQGSIYIASFSEGNIIKISKDGSNKTVFADKTKGLDGPIGLAIDSYDNIYAANYNKGDIVMYDKNAKPTVLMYTKKPYCISLDENKGKIYITEQQNNSVVAFDISDILKSSSSSKKSDKDDEKDKDRDRDKGKNRGESKIISAPNKDKNPIGMPSIRESNFTKPGSQTSITAPIMMPSEFVIDY